MIMAMERITVDNKVPLAEYNLLVQIKRKKISKLGTTARLSTFVMVCCIHVVSTKAVKLLPGYQKKKIPMNVSKGAIIPSPTPNF